MKSLESIINVYKCLHCFLLKDPVILMMKTINGKSTQCKWWIIIIIREWRQRLIVYMYFFRFEYKKETKSYDFIGYCNTYPFYCWPENVRMRIRLVQVF